MRFEFDPSKSEKNKLKHGIDFEDAKELWNDEDRFVMPARSNDENRFALLADRENKIWAAFYTLRETSIRIISLRRARKKEVELYES